MCEANAYIEKNGEETLYLEGVDIIIPEEKGLFMKNLFGEQKLFNGRIKEISLLKHKIMLEENK